ncbi:MAG: transposase [Acidobacteria bacterium]|nr:transposase [Acidobacteriota bacterium]
MRRYDLSFKEEVIRRYMSGETMASLSRETGVNENVLYRWKQKMVVTGSGDADREKLEMRKKIRELEMENEILKKAALILGRPG